MSKVDGCDDRRFLDALRMNLLGGLLFFAILCFAPGFGNDQQALFPEVNFLPRAPVIDGILDSELESLPARRFTTMQKSKSANPGLNIHYRLAYGMKFFYIYIEVEQRDLSERDRGYQNGGGFHIVFANPKPNDQPTDEFYVLGFTPTEAADRRWQRQFIWYHNIDLSMQPLRQTQFKENIGQDVVSLEALIPWPEIYPFHPWLSEAIGFNLCYVQAVGEVENNYHFVLVDKFIQSEQQPRSYVRLEFQAPVPDSSVEMYAILAENHVFAGETTKARVAVLAPEPKKVVQRIALSPKGAPNPFSAQSKNIMAKSFDISLPGLSPEQVYVQTDRRTRKSPGNPHVYSLTGRAQKGLTVLSLDLDVHSLLTGIYDVWFSAAALPHTEFSILPRFDPSNLAKELERSKKFLKKGSLSTLQFELEDLRNELSRLKSYEAGGKLAARMESLTAAVEAAQIGRDEIAQNRMPGLRRRAYRSALDQTLQPYTLRLPQDNSDKRPFPMLVWLHGSGQDDRSLPARLEQLANGFIILSPKARGTSNLYCRDNAQADIREAMADVLENYPVDRGNILLGGFSMGGYGVYRTVYENPSPYKALIIWAGHPNLKGSDIDFLDEKNLTGFRNKDMFIYHGGRDRNCPAEKTLDLVEKLKRTGANVEFHYEPELGHQAPGHETAAALVFWLSKVRRK